VSEAAVEEGWEGVVVVMYDGVFVVFVVFVVVEFGLRGENPGGPGFELAEYGETGVAPVVVVIGVLTEGVVEGGRVDDGGRFEGATKPRGTIWVGLNVADLLDANATSPRLKT